METGLVRPTLNHINIDKTAKCFVNLVKEYRNWFKKGDDLEIEQSDLEREMIECITSYNVSNGFALAKFIEDETGVEGDSELVNILDGVFFVKRELEKDLICKWVKDNNLSISEDVIGRKVFAKQSFRSYPGHYITGIYNDKYQVTIQKDKDSKGGFVIDYENVKLEV